VSGALGVEIDVAPVRRVFGTVVETFGGGKAGFLASGDGNGVDVEFLVALSDEGECLAVGRPAVPIRRSFLRDEARRASGDC
jgi:hypothetical protein